MRNLILISIFLFNPHSHAICFPTDSIKINPSIKQTIDINYSNLTFTNTYKPWQSAYIQYLFKKNKTTLIPKLNIANRYNIFGLQYEIDEYQKLPKKYYVNFNYAFSNSILFANHRYGIEIYKGFNKAHEFSFGIKQLFFNGNTNAVFYTASISTYIKNNLLSYRVFVVPKTHSISTSHIISLRHYLKKEEEFLAITFGIGFAQPENQNSNTVGFSADPAFFLHNQRIAFSLQKFLSSTIQIKPSIELNRQELSVKPNDFQLLYLFSLGLAKKIN